MADKPIIFSAPMVRALLDRRKTQTRRIIKRTDLMECDGVEMRPIPIGYATGNRLWVREAFWLCEECGHRNMCADGANYSGFPDRGCCVSCDALLPRAKTSPIHMPRLASRLTLIVTDVRVQRLQEISEADAVAEGIDRHGDRFSGYGKASDQWMGAIDSFASLWNSIHGPEAWDANPWVVALTFTATPQNIDQIGGKA